MKERNNNKNEKIKRSPSVVMRRKGVLENPGIDPGTSRMLSGRSTV